MIIQGFQRTLAAVERTLTAHESISLNLPIKSCFNQLPLSMVKPYGGADAPHRQDYLVEAVDNQAN